MGRLGVTWNFELRLFEIITVVVLDMGASKHDPFDRRHVIQQFQLQSDNSIIRLPFYL